MRDKYISHECTNKIVVKPLGEIFSVGFSCPIGAIFFVMSPRGGFYIMILFLLVTNISPRWG
jgi:hypothetical protein